MDTIKFANGLVCDCPYLSTLPHMKMAYVAVSGMTFAEAAAIFSNQDMTSEITYGEWILHDYTDLVYIKQEPYGIKACLTGGYDERRA